MRVVPHAQLEGQRRADQRGSQHFGPGLLHHLGLRQRSLSARLTVKRRMAPANHSSATKKTITFTTDETVNGAPPRMNSSTST